MKQLLLATHNRAKLGELRLGVRPLEKAGFSILSLADLKIIQDPEENGKTFRENALIKARFYANLSRIPTIADDGGMLIPHLNNAPGVRSRRWLGYDATDEELISYTIRKLKHARETDRIAYLETCLCFLDPNINKVLFEQKKIKGYIAKKPSGRATEGYPFRALFIVDKYNKYYDELTEQEHYAINHRLKALKRLISKLQ